MGAVVRRGSARPHPSIQGVTVSMDREHIEQLRILLQRATLERDQARRIAVELENEIHACTEGHFFHQGYHDRG